MSGGLRPETLSELASDVERAAAERVPPAVARSLAECYGPGELPGLYRELERVHRKRLARLLVRNERRKGKTVEVAIADVAEAQGWSADWVSSVVYPRKRRG